MLHERKRGLWKVETIVSGGLYEELFAHDNFQSSPNFVNGRYVQQSVTAMFL